MATITRNMVPAFVLEAFKADFSPAAVEMIRGAFEIVYQSGYAHGAELGAVNQALVDPIIAAAYQNKDTADIAAAVLRLASDRAITAAFNACDKMLFVESPDGIDVVIDPAI